MIGKFKKICIIFAVIIGMIFINACYFVFSGQFKATEKINSGKELNVYETFSAYTMHTGCWMFGWVIEPTVAKLAFCSQFNITPKYGHQIAKHVPTNNDIETIKSNMHVGDSVRLAFSNYLTDAAILFNGSTLIYTNLVEYDDDEPNVKHWLYRIPMDYKPGIITIANVKISETLFDYLENKNILHPFDWKYYVLETIYEK